jgi:SRP40, C-terminal domain
MKQGASTNDYGARAHQDLVVTRGSGFRKEKNKKKKGNYRGGEITVRLHSFLRYMAIDFVLSR